MNHVPVASGWDTACVDDVSPDRTRDVIAQIVRSAPGRVFSVDLFTGSAPLVSTITVSGDGFHPSDEGYRLIAERFVTAMRAAGVPLRP